MSPVECWFIPPPPPVLCLAAVGLALAWVAGLVAWEHLKSKLSKKQAGR